MYRGANNYSNTNPSMSYRGNQMRADEANRTLMEMENNKKMEELGSQVEMLKEVREEAGGWCLGLLRYAIELCVSSLYRAHITHTP
jgi:hypothetical protein